MTPVEYNRKWRHANPDKRNDQRQRYYQKTANAKNGRQPYTLEEINMILAHEMPDMELSKKIGRSVQAIQKVRWQYKDRKTNDDNSLNCKTMH